MDEDEIQAFLDVIGGWNWYHDTWHPTHGSVFDVAVGYCLLDDKMLGVVREAVG